MNRYYLAVDSLICDTEDVVWGAILIAFSDSRQSYRVIFSSIDNIDKTIKDEKKKIEDKYKGKKIDYKYFNLASNNNGTSWKMCKYRKIVMSYEDLIKFNFDREEIYVEPYKISSFIRTLVDSNARYLPVNKTHSVSDFRKRLFKDMDFDGVTLKCGVYDNEDFYPILTSSGNLENFKFIIHKQQKPLFDKYNIHFESSTINLNYIVGEVNSGTVVTNNTDLIKDIPLGDFKLRFVGMPISMLIKNQAEIDNRMIEFMTLKLIDNNETTLSSLSLTKASNTYKVYNRTESDTLAFPVFRSTAKLYTQSDIISIKNSIYNIVQTLVNSKADTVTKNSKMKELKLALIKKYGGDEVLFVLRACYFAELKKIDNPDAILEVMPEIVTDLINSCLVVSTFKKAARLYGINKFKDLIREYSDDSPMIRVDTYREESYEY